MSDDISDLFETKDEGIPNTEERRVFYVAMIRTRRRLFIINCMDEKVYAQSVRSPFVTELLGQSPILSRTTPLPRVLWADENRVLRRENVLRLLRFPHLQGDQAVQRFMMASPRSIASTSIYSNLRMRWDIKIIGINRSLARDGTRLRLWWMFWKTLRPRG